MRQASLITTTARRLAFAASCTLLAAPGHANAPDLSLVPSPRPSVAQSEEPARPALRPATTALTAAEELARPSGRFSDWIDGFRTRALRAGITAETFDAAFAGITLNSTVLERDRNQSEFSRALWDYLDSAVSSTRIGNGRRALQEHRAALAEIERIYRVEAEVVAAIWGLESAYGAVRGDTNIIEAMATLAYDGRRNAFFETQLLAALRILQDGDISRSQMTGSWAGAMGHTQFMPTSFLDYAVDQTGDGRRDIWSDNPIDALASTANYLREFGWTYGQPWGLEVALPDGFDYAQTGERFKRPARYWNTRNVRLVSGERVTDHGPASILLPAGAEGVALVIFDNFHVIERYNPADAYVIAVGLLSDRILGGPAFDGTWPRQDRALSFDERQELQRRLTRVGFSPGRVDGIIGPNTIDAVRRYQQSEGLLPDGYAALAILDRLR